jgi:hypothetical protein
LWWTKAAVLSHRWGIAVGAAISGLPAGLPAKSVSLLSWKITLGSRGLAMRTSIGLITALVLGSAALIASSGVSPAAARIKGGAALLSVCIANFNACEFNCNFYFPLPPPNSCTRMCSSNHAACVDLAFGGVAAARRARPTR